VETELLATLQTVQQAKKANAKRRPAISGTRSGRGSGSSSGHRAKAKAATTEAAADLASLAKLMEVTSVS
jgi:hypothetical protein